MPPKQIRMLDLWPWLARSLGGWAATPISEVQGVLTAKTPHRGLALVPKAWWLPSPLWNISVLAAKL